MHSIHTSLSAIRAVGRKMAVTADNIANAQTEGFKKSRTVITQGEADDVQAHITRDNTQGPMVTETVGGEMKTTEKSNVDLTEEMPQLMVAKHAYRANLKSIRTQDEMLGMVIDLVG